MTEEQISVLRYHANTLAESSRAILAYSLGDRAFTYDPLAIEMVYEILDKSVNFERLSQVLVAHSELQKQPIPQ